MDPSLTAASEMSWTKTKTAEAPMKKQTGTSDADGVRSD